MFHYNLWIFFLFKFSILLFLTFTNINLFEVSASVTNFTPNHSRYKPMLLTSHETANIDLMTEIINNAQRSSLLSSRPILYFSHSSIIPQFIGIIFANVPHDDNIPNWFINETHLIVPEYGSLNHEGRDVCLLCSLNLQSSLVGIFHDDTHMNLATQENLITCDTQNDNSESNISKFPATLFIDKTNPLASIGLWQCKDDYSNFSLNITFSPKQISTISPILSTTEIPVSTVSPFEEGDPIQVRLDSATPVTYDVEYRMITWHLELSKWMVSEHYHNCSAFVSVQEKSIEWWFHESMLNNVSLRSNHRPKRDAISTGLGIYGSVKFQNSLVHCTSEF
ncbi:uncharacterized protein LOC121399972 [Xenopus laevis]|uniref:Uncharacterized protein LOC121399972 n=1 Tax=Xenopus laevis TaxID=8355 RepID=A0A8J1M8I1_XENLA|nr:uncharacterized protein LOC121399972 [Xenopus laevis]